MNALHSSSKTHPYYGLSAKQQQELQSIYNHAPWCLVIRRVAHFDAALFEISAIANVDKTRLNAIKRLGVKYGDAGSKRQRGLASEATLRRLMLTFRV